MYNAEDIKYLLGQRCSEPGEQAASGGHGKKTNPMKSCLCFKVLITPLQLGRGVRGGLSALGQGRSCWNDPLEAAPDHSLPKQIRRKNLGQLMFKQVLFLSNDSQQSPPSGQGCSVPSPPSLQRALHPPRCRQSFLPQAVAAPAACREWRSSFFRNSPSS